MGTSMGYIGIMCVPILYNAMCTVLYVCMFLLCQFLCLQVRFVFLQISCFISVLLIGLYAIHNKFIKAQKFPKGPPNF